MSDNKSKEQPEKNDLLTTISLKDEQSINLKSGYELNIAPNPQGDRLRIKAPDGRICLNLTLKPEGNGVELEADSLDINVKENLSLEAKTLEIKAREELTMLSQNIEIGTHDDLILEAGGDLVNNAWKNILHHAKGTLQSRAFSQFHKAEKGDIHFKANDDFLADGEVIRLNSPRDPGKKDDIGTDDIRKGIQNVLSYFLDKKE